MIKKEMKNKENLIFIRDLLGLFLVIWCINPEQRFYNWWIYGIILVFWGTFAFITEPAFYIKKLLLKPHIIVLFVWPIVRGIYALFGRATFSIYLFTVPFIYILFWFYLNQDEKIRNFYLEIILIYYILINCISIIRLSINPNISRLLANGDIQKTKHLASPFTANYFHIYTLTFLVVLCIGVLKIEWKHKPQNMLRIYREILVFVVTGIVVIFKAQYTYAILFVTFFSIFILIFKPIKLSIKDVITVGICLILGGIILFTLLYILAFLIDNKYMIERFNEMFRLITTGNLSQGRDMYKRFELYFSSINTFLKYPLFGIGGKEILEASQVGGHSEVLDCLAYYGMIGFMSFMSGMIVNFRKLLDILSESKRYIYIICFSVFIVQSIVNTCYGEQILSGLYIVAPLILLYKREGINIEGAKDET